MKFNIWYEKNNMNATNVLISTTLYPHGVKMDEFSVTKSIYH